MLPDHYGLGWNAALRRPTLGTAFSGSRIYTGLERLILSCAKEADQGGSAT